MADTDKSTAFQHAKQDLINAIAKLRTEDGWQAWLKAKTLMPTYSWLNQIRVWMQDPEATLVRGKSQWKNDFNRSVTTWAPIWILAPSYKKVEPEGPEDDGKRVYFRAVRVHDVRNTTQIPGEEVIPLSPPSEPITGDTHRYALAHLLDYAESLNYTVEFFDWTGGALGSHHTQEQRIRIGQGPAFPANRQVHVLVHELAHALGIRGDDEGTPHVEACCETAAHLACAAIGLDVSGEAVAYIAAWHDAAEEVIESDLKRIQAIVNQISEAVTGPENDETPAEAEVPSAAS